MKRKIFYLQIICLLIFALAIFFFVPNEKVFAEDKTKLSSYVMTDDITIPQKNQNDYSLCWAFASCRSVETFILKNYDAVVDLSESWASLAYYHYVNDSNNTLDAQNDYPAYKYGDAGHYLNFQRAINTYGVVYEENLPYGKEAFDDFTSGFVIQTTDYESAYTHYSTFTSNEICRIDFNWAGYFRKADKKEKSLKEVVGYIKEYVVQFGSMYTQINIYDHYTVDSKDVIYSETRGTNHAVSIIGWDDEFVYNDLTGAFVVMNSYGATQEILYVPYEDANVLGQAQYIKSITFNGKTTIVDLDAEDLKKTITLISISGVAVLVAVIPTIILFSKKEIAWKKM